MKQYLIFAIILLFMVACNSDKKENKEAETSESKQESTKSQQGSFKKYPDFDSKYIGNRKVDVWLPPNYTENTDKKYPVLYMHDGQNIFDPNTAYGGTEWGIDENMLELIEKGEIREAIVVGVWNAEAKRTAEYIPQKMLKLTQAQKDKLYSLINAEPYSDDYLKFLVEELKPFIDKEFRTLTDKDNTFMMGSSMGGLISIYGIMEYPDVFGGVACVSTHWALDAYTKEKALPQMMIDYVAENLPEPENHKIYFDFGTATLDSLYEPYQNKVDDLMRKKGYEENKNWLTRKFEGAEHNEKYWRKRVKIPLKFLLEGKN